MSLSDYALGFSANLNGPMPLFLGRLDALIEDFLRLNQAAGQFRALHLLFYSFGNLRASIILSQGGATASVPSVLRNCVESAAYSVLFQDQKDWWENWRNRDESETARRKIRSKEFSLAIKEALQARRETLATQYRNIYETLISFGAHPNELAILGISDFIPLANDMFSINYTMLSGDDTDRLRTNILIGQSSVFVASVLATLWHERAAELDAWKSLHSICTSIELCIQGINVE